MGDADVLKCIRMLTFIPVEEIDSMDSWEGSKLNEAKEILAFELTKTVHGEEEAEKARTAAKSLFVSGGTDAPETVLTEADLTDGGIDILSLLVKAELAASRSEARRAVEQGGVSADGEKISDIKKTFTAEALRAGVLLKKGKKSFKKAIIK